MSESQPNRLHSGGAIDRTRSLSFSFDGRLYCGFSGDTLASALLGAGVKLFGRSFKYHRPRGILTAGVDEPNALVELRSRERCEPNTKATVVELFDGLDARSQNRWPSLSLDFGAINSLLSPFLPAGFYYKTFMWPPAWWEKLYEPAIRRAAGLGRASHEPDPDRYEKAHSHCDVLVIGGGPAGLSAALSAARRGERVVLCEEDRLLGGRLNGDLREINGLPGSTWVQQVEAELASNPKVRIFKRTTVFGAYDGEFGALERVADHLATPGIYQPRQRLWKIIAKRSVLAAGAIERSIVFGGNDKPGVMMASAVRTYVNRFAVTPGHRVAVFTTTDDGWRTASDLARVGVRVEAIVDARPAVGTHLSSQAKSIGARLFTQATVVEAHGTTSGLTAISVRENDGRVSRIKVDTLAVSGGWNPNLALTTHLGERPRWSDDIAAFIPGGLPPGMVVVGAARGDLSLTQALQQGAAAGGGAETPTAGDWRTDDETTAVKPLWWVPESRGKSFVDFQNDVTVDDVEIAAREGYQSVEHLKRYTTLGMATDQGKTSSLNGHAIMATLTGKTPAEAGTTTFRPPYTPLAIGAIAGAHRGKHSHPTRLTAGHSWAQERGASFVESGDWLRAQWFAAPEESYWLDTVLREVKTVRSRAGVCDVSTLGKIDIQGPDAAKFLDRVYINMFSTLPIGKARYGLMLREDGFVMDDGTTARLASERYVMSTTTANAGRVMQHLEHASQVLWPDLDVQLGSVSEQWAQYCIAGPESRRILSALLGSALDVSNTAFPYLACAEFNWEGMTARLFRISFSGELSYELAVPARYGDATIRAIMQAGEPLGLVPYGLEALGTMRIEKGHVAGSELNGTTTAADLGFARMMSQKKDFIGRVLSGRPALTSPLRPVLVGIQPVNPQSRLNGGAHLLTLGEAATLENDQGYVTSATFSPMLDRWIGLGLLVRGRERHGERMRIYDPLRDADFEADVVSPVFYDPDGSRLNT